MWSDGTPLGPYTNWKNGNIDNDPNKDCVQYEIQKGWIIEDCHEYTSNGFICETGIDRSSYTKQMLQKSLIIMYY